MNFDNNHFIDAGSNISGFLYGTKRHYDSRYDGKGTKQPSTYSEEVFIYPEPKAVQRSNGFSEGGGELGSGILIGGVDFKAEVGGYVSNEVKGYRATLCRSLGGWFYIITGPHGFIGKSSHPLTARVPEQASVETVAKDAAWVLAG